MGFILSTPPLNFAMWVPPACAIFSNHLKLKIVNDTILIVGLIKKTLRKSKKTYYQVYLSTKARRPGQSSASYGKNSTAFLSSSNGSATLSKRGYFTIWDDNNQPCSVNHPYFKDFFTDHGLDFSDFKQETLNKSKQTPSVSSVSLHSN